MTARGLVLTLLGCLAVAGCAGNEGPVAGELEVRLATPNGDDRAVHFRLVGAQTAVTAPPGTAYRVFVSPEPGSDTARVVVVAAQGTALAPGPLARVMVPDTRRAAAYAAGVLEVASTAYGQRAPAGYVLTVVRP